MGVGGSRFARARSHRVLLLLFPLLRETGWNARSLDGLPIPSQAGEEAGGLKARGGAPVDGMGRSGETSTARRLLAAGGRQDGNGGRRCGRPNGLPAHLVVAVGCWGQGGGAAGVKGGWGVGARFRDAVVGKRGRPQLVGATASLALAPPEGSRPHRASNTSSVRLCRAMAPRSDSCPSPDPRSRRRLRAAAGKTRSPSGPDCSWRSIPTRSLQERNARSRPWEQPALTGGGYRARPGIRPRALSRNREAGRGRQERRHFSRAWDHDPTANRASEVGRPSLRGRTSPLLRDSRPGRASEASGNRGERKWRGRREEEGKTAPICWCWRRTAKVPSSGR